MKWLILGALLLPLISFGDRCGIDLPYCDTETPLNELCVVRLNIVHPLQSCIGRIEVKFKHDELELMSGKEREKFLRKNPIPLIEWRNHYYMYDHHHLGMATQMLGQKKTWAVITERWGNLTQAEFFARLKRKNFVYLKKLGEPLNSPKDLPNWLSEMEDDWYRSLTWGVRKAGGFKKTSIRFADFQWADFFRTRIEKQAGKDGFKRAVEKGIKLALSDDASELPGYLGD